MPGGDGTGPRGLGPMTGRAAGYCAGYPTPGFANSLPRMGLGLGRLGGFSRYPQENIQSGQYPYGGYSQMPYNYSSSMPMRPYYGMGFFGGRGGGRGRGRGFRHW